MTRHTGPIPVEAVMSPSVNALDFWVFRQSTISTFSLNRLGSTMFAKIDTLFQSLQSKNWYTYYYWLSCHISNISKIQGLCKSILFGIASSRSYAHISAPERRRRRGKPKSMFAQTLKLSQTILLYTLLERSIEIAKIVE